VRKWTSYVKAFVCECVHLITRGHLRARDKDGGNTIRSAVDEDPMIHANLMALCVGPNLWPIEVLHRGNKDFRFFDSCNLDLDPMTFIYELDPYSVELYRVCKYELPIRRGFWKDRHTDRRDRNYIPCRFAGGQILRRFECVETPLKIDTVGLVVWPVKIVPEMTYNVSSGTLSIYTTTTTLKIGETSEPLKLWTFIASL